jgi:hypothetical protein
MTIDHVAVLCDDGGEPFHGWFSLMHVQLFGIVDARKKCTEHGEELDQRITSSSSSF